MARLTKEQKKALYGAVKEISNSMTRMEAERDLIKEAVKVVSDECQIPKKIVNKIARAYHKQNLTQSIEEHNEFVELYQEVTAKSSSSAEEGSGNVTSLKAANF